MRLLIPTAFVLFLCLSTTGCKKEKLEEKIEEILDREKIYYEKNNLTH